MKYCDKCKVSVRGTSTRCPLCQHPLSGENDPAVYPVVKTVYHQYELFFKALIMLTVSGGIVSLALNLIFRESGFWSLSVLLSICCFWVILALAVKKRKNIPKNIVYQALTVSVSAIVFDLITGWSGWSLDFVFPITCMAAIAAMMIIAKLMRIAQSDYLVYLAADALFGVIPIILYFLDLTNVFLPSIICTTVSLISLCSIVIFQGGAIRLELMKRFHL